jgi:clan AA aspartic protease (TIGR02281 family)
LKYSVLIIAVFVVAASLGYGEIYKWLDEEGTVHFADDLSNVPEKYRPDAEMRKTPKEIPPSEDRGKRVPPPAVSNLIESEGMEIDLIQRHELLLAEVILNHRLKQHFVVDTGASFTLINRHSARELDVRIDENTPSIPISTASSVVFTPLVTLKSIRVGKAEVENVDVLIHDMPSGGGLLGNSFLNRFKVVLDSIHGKMTLYSEQGIPSPDRPGGYGRDHWVGQFRFYNRILEDLQRAKKQYEGRGTSSELSRVNGAIRYFEIQLGELERRASYAGVPRNWRE